MTGSIIPAEKCTPTSHSYMYPTHETHVHTGSDLFAARRWRQRPSRPVGVISSPHTTTASSLFTASWHVHHSFAVVFISLSCIRRTHEKLVSNAKMTPPLLHDEPHSHPPIGPRIGQMTPSDDGVHHSRIKVYSHQPLLRTCTLHT